MMAGMISFMLASCLNSINGFLSSPVTGWFPFVIIGVFVILFALALIYALSPLIGRSDMRSWSRIKMYETLFSLLLIMVFLGFASMLCSQNPTPAYSSVGLVPNGAINCNNANVDSIYALSECDLYGFNQQVIGNLNNYLFGLQAFLTIPPDVTFSLDIGQLLGFGVGNVGFEDKLSFSPLSLIGFIGNAVKIVATFFILAQVQFLLLQSSLLIFAIFLAIGLIARIFGVTRSFGGAMIAFALGIGFVFPVMVSITYGYIDQAINLFGVTSFSSLALQASSVIATLANYFATGTNPGVLIATYFEPLINMIGMMIIGTMLVPFINFVVIDTFIIDFSSAVGERMDFLRLLTSIA